LLWISNVSKQTVFLAKTILSPFKCSHLCWTGHKCMALFHTKFLSIIWPMSQRPDRGRTSIQQPPHPGGSPCLCPPLRAQPISLPFCRLFPRRICGLQGRCPLLSIRMTRARARGGSGTPAHSAGTAREEATVATTTARPRGSGPISGLSRRSSRQRVRWIPERRTCWCVSAGPGKCVLVFALWMLFSPSAIHLQTGSVLCTVPSLMRV
jgi:hypothetical protein